MLIKSIRRLKEEKKELQKEIDDLLMKKKFLKTDNCDFCVKAAIDYKIKSSEVNEPYYYYNLFGWKLKLCKSCAQALYKGLEKELKNDTCISGQTLR